MNITRQDKQTVVEIIVQSMGSLPGIKWTIGNDPRKVEKRLHALAEYVFETAYLRKAILLSTDKKGVAVFYRKDAYKMSLTDYWNRVRFALHCTGLGRAFEIYKRERYYESKRPCSGKYLYFWMFSVLPSARGIGAAATELKNIILTESERQQLPIYLETSNPQNKRVYERYGFRVYHEWFVQHRNITIWFMRRGE